MVRGTVLLTTKVVNRTVPLTKPRIRHMNKEKCTQDNIKKGIIISGGRIEDDFACAFLMREGILTSSLQPDSAMSSRIIAADRGLEFCERHGIVPGHASGDFDSARPGLAESFTGMEGVEVAVYPSRKNYTDTQIAVDLAIRLGMKEVTVLGATGTRQDHFLGNIQVLEYALLRGTGVTLLDSHNRIRMIGADTGVTGAGKEEGTGAGLSELTLSEKDRFGDYFSLIPWGGPAEQVTVRGASYELTDAFLSTSETLGISNEPAGRDVHISVGKGKLIVAESRD